MWRERENQHQLDMIKKTELDLLNCNRQYVFKTHKGEQVLEDSRPTDAVESTEIITGLTSADSASGESLEGKKELKEKGKKHGRGDRERSRDRKVRTKDKGDR